MLFLNEPKAFAEVSEGEVLLMPVVQKNIGVEDLDGRNALYWHEIYKACGVDVFRFVTTVLRNTKILEYCNTGHIVAHRQNALYKNWLENFELVIQQKYEPLQGHYCIEQSIFAAPVAQLKLNVKSLGVAYNAPARHFQKIVNPEFKLSNFSEITTLHYHKYFSIPEVVNPLKGEMLKRLHGAQLNKMVKDSGVLEKISWSDNIKRKLTLKMDILKQRFRSNKL